MKIFNFLNNENDNAQINGANENFAIISFQTNGTIISANRNFLDTLGYKSSEVVGQHHKIFCDKQYISTTEYEIFWDDLRKGISKIDEFKRIKKDGSSVWIQASYTPIKNKNGKVTRVIKFAQDITDRKLQTSGFKAQLNAIGKSNAVIEFDMTGTILNANDNFLNTLGYTENEIIGKKHNMFCESSYKNSDEYREFWKKLNRGEFDSGEYLRVGKNNKEVWIQASYNPIMDIDGTPYKVVKYAQDISAKKKIAFAVENTSKELTISAQDLYKRAESLSNSASQTSAESEEASTSVEEISQGSNNISEKLSLMLNSVDSISKFAKSAKNITKEAQSKSKVTTVAIDKLRDESSKISETVEVITQIAFQTNILSLNAAVEAATAGEAGKGFAVVAQEVRNLASRSDESAKKITDAIEFIQKLVKQSQDSIISINATIENMSNISTDIVTSIKEQGTISRDVSMIMNESQIGINNIAETIQNVANNATKSGVEANHTLEASKNLNELSENLSSVLIGD